MVGTLAPVGIQTVPLADIKPSPLNPRKRIDPESIAELAESIKAEGLLQNLVVRRASKRKRSDPAAGVYEIAAGERRYRALCLLLDEHHIDAQHPVPVVVRELTDLQLVQLATTENIARKDMTPLEEARAFQSLVDLGSDVDTIAAETGMSLRTVRTRLALVERLAPEAVAALEAGEINLGTAQALTNASPETQQRLIKTQHQGYELTAARVKHDLSFNAVPVSRAKFPIDRYKGEIIDPGIFAEPDAEPTFADREEFLKLQEAWKDMLVESYSKSWAWVEVVSYYSRFDYETPTKKERLGPKGLGVVLEWKPSSGELKVHEGLKRRGGYSSSAPRAAKDPLALSTKHETEIKRVHTQALQRAVLEADPYITVALVLVAVTSAYSWNILPLRAERRDDRAEDVAAVRDLLAELHPGLTERNGRMVGGGVTLDLLKTLLPMARGPLAAEDRWRLVAALRDVLAQHVGVSDRYGIGDKATAPYLLEHLDARLPTWRDLGADWLKLYPKARLEQIHEEATGLESKGLTRKAMIAGVLDHPKPGWLDGVPPELGDFKAWQPQDDEKDLDELIEEVEREFNEAEYPEEYADEDAA